MYSMNDIDPGVNRLNRQEQHFTEMVRNIGGKAVLEFFNDVELSQSGAIAGPGEDSFQAIAFRGDNAVDVRYNRVEAFKLDYPVARKIAVNIAREETVNEASTLNTKATKD